jgi:hypothetical protein
LILVKAHSIFRLKIQHKPENLRYFSCSKGSTTWNGFITQVLIDVHTDILDRNGICKKVEHKRRPKILEVTEKTQSISEDEFKTIGERIAIIDNVREFIPDRLGEIVNHGFVVYEIGESIGIVDQFIVLG